MSKFFGVVLIGLFVSFSASANCWLTELGEKRFKNLSIDGCPGNPTSNCIAVVDLNGNETTEKLSGESCSATVCSLSSRHFRYVIRSSGSSSIDSVQSTYIADLSGNVLQICSGL